MTNHWAIAVGINQYQSLQPLNFAQQDAQSLCEGLVSEAGFLPEHCILMTDNSPEVVGRSTYPSRDNLQHWIKFFKQDMIHKGDWVWVFFSGYGVCQHGEDYLLPINGDPKNIESSSVSVRSLYEQLRNLPSDRLLVLLDINRAPAATPTEKLGTQIADLAREFKIPTLLSCRPEEYAHESPALGHGLFTSALLEGLHAHQCSTLGNLEDFLTARLPELCDHNNHPIQHPVLLISDPEEVHQTITPVNWEETEEWKEWTPEEEPASNPFSLEGDFFDASVMELEPVLADSAPNRAEVASFEPVSFPSDTAVVSASPSRLPLTAESEPILELDAQGDPIYTPSKTALMPLPPDPTVRPTPCKPDGKAPDQFWERLLFGGSAVLLVLLLGVVIRNWTTFAGQQTTANNSAPIAEKPKTTPAPVKPTAKPKSSQSLLAEAQSLTRPASASDASKAIRLARKVPQDDPLYGQAQQDIDRWSRNILDIAKQRAQQKQFKQAIFTAQLVPKDRAQTYAEAQKAIAQWKKAK
jgi:Caspase domain